MKLTIVEAVQNALETEMKLDENIIVLGEDVGVDGGVFRATEGLLKKFGEKRVMDTPLSESAIIGTSIGMSFLGLKPVAEIQFSGFLYAGFDQLISHASRFRNRTRGQFNCQMVVRAPYSGGIRALEHHSESMEAIYCHTPGLKVVIPSTPYDTKGLLIASIRDPDPVIFLEPKKIYRSIKQEVPEKDYAIELGKASVVRQGDKVTIVGYGSMLHECLKAAETLSKEGIECEVIDLRTISPIDEKTILDSVQKTGRIVIVHEAPRNCGVGAEIAAIIAEKGMYYLDKPIKRVTGFDTIVPLFRLEQHYYPNEFRIIKAVKELM